MIRACLRLLVGGALVVLALALGGVVFQATTGQSLVDWADRSASRIRDDLAEPPWVRDAGQARGQRRATAEMLRRTEERQPDRPGPIRRTSDAFVAAVGDTLRVSGLAALVLLLPLAVGRLYFRRRRARRAIALELALSREDIAQPFEVQKAFENWRAQFLARWYERPWRGQDSFTLEVARQPLEGGRHEIRFLATCQPHMVGVLRAGIENLYPDVRVRLLEPGRAAELRGAGALRHVWRRKLARGHIFSLQTSKDYQHSFVEALVSAMAGLDGRLVVQLALTPAPALVERRARRLLKRRERGLTEHAHEDAVDLGVGSVVEAQELKGALESQAHGLYFADLRVAGERALATRQLAGTFGSARSENELVPRHMRLRRRLFLRRLRSGAPNLIPGLQRGIVPSSVLAYLWQLPRLRAKHAAIPRSSVRRAAAPRAVCREHELAALHDEHGPVAIAERDRKYGYQAIGGQGGGKSSFMLRSFASDVRRAEPRKAAVMLDPKGPLAELALEVVPAERTVHYLDLGDPEFGLNPLAAPLRPGVRAGMVVDAVREAMGADSVRARSDAYLRNATTAVCAAHDWLRATGRGATLEALELPEQPSFSELYWMLSDGGDGYRELVRRALEGEPRSAFQRAYWGPGGEFEALRRENRRALLEQLEAPLNKIRRLVSTAEIQMLLEHPRLVSIAELIDRGEVLIVNGAKDQIGEDNAQLVFLFLLQLIHRALQGRQRLPLERRRPVAVHVDEAHNVMSRSLATMAAEGRSAGLQLGLAYQYAAQIEDELVKSGVRSLCQSVIAFRLRELEDARALSGLAMEVYQDVIQAHEELQERLRFSADDLVRLPEYHALCMLVADGAPQPAFIAQTLPMEPLADPDRARQHRAAQLERGCAPLVAPPDLRPPTEDELDQLPLPAAADGDGNGRTPGGAVGGELPAVVAETIARDELERDQARRAGGDDL